MVQTSRMLAQLVKAQVVLLAFIQGVYLYPTEAVDR